MPVGRFPLASRVLRDVRLPLLEGSPSTPLAIAIAGGRILAIGSPDELDSLTGPETETESLEGRPVLPAFTDAHLHLELYARSLDQVDCETPTMQACIERLRLKSESAPPGTWILGHGWNDNLWGHPPDPAALDAALPHHPAYMTAKSLHAGWANACALRTAGVTAGTPDPPGGTIVRSAAGVPTGVLLESAAALVSGPVPPPSPADLDRLVDAAQQSLWRLGIAAVHDFDGPRLLQSVQRLRDAGRLGLRVLKSIPASELPAAVQLGLSSGMGDEWIRLGHLKLFADGALGPRTAAMTAPYLGEPANLGTLLLDEEMIGDIGRRAALNGLPLAVHAIGDRATHAVLRALRTLAPDSPALALPHRVEHLQLLHQDALPLLRGTRGIASMQPIHATSDMLMADRYWGDRVRLAYAWRTVLAAGWTLAFGSDAPVESPDPIAGLRAAVTRRRADGTPGMEGWTPKERLTLREAIAAYTLGPAAAAGMARVQGKIRPGYLADLIVTDVDPFSVPPDQLGTVRVLATMVGGAWQYRQV